MPAKHSRIGRNNPSFKHGHRSQKRFSKTYYIWAAMRQRCSNPRNKSFKNYGARGIRVCPRWDDYAAFLTDMGERPTGYTIERLDNNGDYSPANCKWGTRLEQNRNCRKNLVVTVRGITGVLRELCAHFGVCYSTVYYRLVQGWSEEDAFFLPRYHRYSAHQTSHF